VRSGHGYYFTPCVRDRMVIILLPTWAQDHIGQEARDLDLEAYFEYQRLRSTFATFFNIYAFVKMSGISTQVFQQGWGGTLKMTWDQANSNNKAATLRVLFEGRNHYDLLFQYAKDEPDVQLAKKARVVAAKPIRKRPAAAT
jgi:hypothetical protein